MLTPPEPTQKPVVPQKATLAVTSSPAAEKIADTAEKLNAVLEDLLDKTDAEKSKGRANVKRHAAAPRQVILPDDPEPLDLDQPIENLLARVRSRDDLVRIFEGMKHDEPEPYVAPPMSAKLAARVTIEMEKGRASLARRVEDLKTRMPATPTEAEMKERGSSSVVQRPGDFVPSMNQGRQPQGRR